MNRGKFNAQEHIAALNAYKNSTTIFSKSSLQEIFRICGIPSNGNFFSYFKKSGLIVPIGKDKYKWKDNKPIHFQALQNVYSDYQNKANQYIKDYLCRKRQLEIEKENAIISAITLLKENGYEVFLSCDSILKKVTPL